MHVNSSPWWMLTPWSYRIPPEISIWPQQCLMPYLSPNGNFFSVYFACTSLLHFSSDSLPFTHPMYCLFLHLFFLYLLSSFAIYFGSKCVFLFNPLGFAFHPHSKCFQNLSNCPILLVTFHPIALSGTCFQLGMFCLVYYIFLLPYAGWQLLFQLGWSWQKPERGTLFLPFIFFQVSRLFVFTHEIMSAATYDCGMFTLECSQFWGRWNVE